MSIITISSIFEDDFDNFCDFCGNTCVSYLIDTTGYEDGLTEYIFRPIWFRYLDTPIKFSNDEKGKEAFLRNFCNQLNEVVFDFYTYCKENIDYFMYQTNPLNEGKPMSKNITTGISPINQNIDQTVDSTSLASGTGSQYISETVYNGVAWHKLVDAYFTPNRKTALLKAFQWLFISVYSPETKYDDKIEEKRYVQLSFVDDDNNIIDEQKVYPTKSYFTMSEVEIQRPLMLDPQNIKKDVDIAGVVGTYEPNIYPRIYDLLRLDNPDGEIIYNTPSGYDGIEGVTITIPDTAVAENIKLGINIGGIIGTYAGGVDYLENRVVANNGSTPYAYENNNITQLVECAFAYDLNLTSFSSTSVTRFVSGSDNKTFYNCTNLLTVNIPNLETLCSNCFADCRNLQTVNLPKVNFMQNSTFSNCRQLTTINMFENYTDTIKTYCFYYCTSLQNINIHNSTSIGSNVFGYCSALTDITITKTSVCTLSATNAFANIGHTVTIHVPSSLIASYQTATNWSTLYNNGDVTFVAI